MLSGAEDETRTRTAYATRPSNVRGYQLRHLGKDLKSVGRMTLSTEFSISRTYLLTFAVFALTLVFVTVIWLESTTIAVFDGAVLALASTTTAVFVLPSVGGAVVVSVVVSAPLVSSTERFPVSAGIAKSSADSIKVVAATIVIFDRIVCEPRGENAVLEMLLVNSAPASVLPGCNKTLAISTTHEVKNNVYKK